MSLQRLVVSLGCALALFGSTAAPVLAASTSSNPLQPAVSEKVNRPIHLEGAENVRDLGGYKSRYGLGLRVKSGRLLRSDSLDKLTDTDVSRLTQGYNVRQIVDLRTADQIHKKPDALFEGVNYMQASILGTRSNYDNDDEGMYKDMAFKPAAKKSYHHLLTQMAKQKRGALLFHCSHGMDRTGTSAAIIYSILGVSRKDIERDYLLSNTQLNVTWAKPALLNQFFDDVQMQYGSMANYIHKGLHINRAQELAIRANYLTARK